MPVMIWFRSFVLLQLFSTFALGNISIRVSDPSIATEVPITVTWTRSSPDTDATHFFLQSVLLPAELGRQAELVEVNTTKDIGSGTAGVVSHFTGPHIVMAFDPTDQRPLLCSSNTFDVVKTNNAVNAVPGVATTQTPATGGTTTIELIPASPTSVPSAPQTRTSSSEIATGVVAGVLSGVAFIGLIVLIIWRLRANGYHFDFRRGIYRDPKPGNGAAKESVQAWLQGPVPQRGTFSLTPFPLFAPPRYTPTSSSGTTSGSLRPAHPPRAKVKS